ncbi:hypothetical protein PSPO01_05054 [Paraphaeosphaeria sporulosa]
MRRPNLTPSDTVTSITPPSFVDDGLNLSRRMPRAEHRDVNSWLEGAQASVAPPVVSPTSAASETIYTGSFIDDGADMVYPSVPIVPGCGIVDRAFYSKGKWRTSKYDAEWTIEKEKALAGDMWRSLARMRSIARVEVKDAGEAHRREEKKRRKEHRVGAVENDGRVRIPKPLTWGTFVIEGSDGRVVVVDKEADYDSGRPGEREEMGAREREYEERIGKRKAKDAARREKESDKEVKVRAAVEARERREREEEEKARAQAASGDQQRKDEHRRHRCRQPSSRLLAPIPEAHTPEESVTDIVSPTKFFMTGVRSEPFSTTHRHTMLSAKPPSLSKYPPGAWPVPQLSPIKPVLSIRSSKSPTTLSKITSVTRSDDSWVEQACWDQEAAAVRRPSSTSSGRYSNATPSTTSGAAPQGSRSAMRFWMPDDKRSKRSSSLRVASGGRSKAGSVDTRRGYMDYDLILSPRRRESSHNQSRGSSKDTWTGDVDRQSARTTPRRRRSRETSSNRSDGSWKRNVDGFEPRVSGRALRSPTKSCEAFRARSNDSWKRDVDEFETRVSYRTSRSPTKSPIASVSAWIQGDDNNTVRSVHSPSKSATSRVSGSRGKQTGNSRRAPSVRSHKSAGSRTSVVTPYSWRRQVEEISDHSTAGSNGSNSRGPSLIRSDDRGSDGELVAEHDEDTRSVRSHSTYRAPTVEDAPESEDGAQEWNSAWSVKDSRGHGHNAEDGGSQAGVEASVAGSARWSGKTGWGGDVETPGSVAEGAKWDGSAAGSRVESDWKDQSGYAEENDTWLNSEVRGVKYREAEWRKDAIEGSWRDVW